MKTIPSEKSSRCWTVAEIPQQHPDDLAELEVTLHYTGKGSCAKGCTIDDFVVPLFRLAPRLLEVVRLHTVFGLATLGLTPDELAEVKRLSGDFTIARK